jgi:hypothetical protein
MKKKSALLIFLFSWAVSNAQIIVTKTASPAFAVANVNSITSAASTALALNGNGDVTINTTNGATWAATFSGANTSLAGMLQINVTGANNALTINSDTAGRSVMVLNNTAVNVGNRNWLIGLNQVVFGDIHFLVGASAGAAPSIDAMGLTATAVTFPQTTSGTSTTAAAVMAYSIGLLENAYVGGNLSMATAGGSISVKSGANGLSGTVTLAAGTATITSTAIDANTVIIFSNKTPGGTPGLYQPLATVSAGSAAVTSLATDTSTYNWIGLKVN